MVSKLWDRNNPLFFYGNEEKLDDLIGRIYGEVVTQFQYSHKEGGKATLKLAAKIGGFLSALGLGEASGELGSEVSAEKAKERIVKIPFDSKINALHEYCSKNEDYPYINVHEGKVLRRRRGKLVSDWQGRDIEETDKMDRIGHVLGLFNPRRVSPPHDDTISIVDEFMNQKKHLWLFSSIEDSKIYCKVPVILSNTRLNSQHAVLAFAKMAASDFKIESFGLLTWQNDSVTCDPIAWRLFY
ncbi:hypothetical protein KAR91_60945 [Candidatus Pacearchaeota archaeon]|nr:hypothetical protein [Candidatus Pacearchaeota archaeon]